MSIKFVNLFCFGTIIAVFSLATVIQLTFWLNVICSMFALAIAFSNILLGGH